MQDTTPGIRQKHLDIIFSKTEEERLIMAVEMMEEIRKIVMRSIHLENPAFSEMDCRLSL